MTNPFAAYLAPEDWQQHAACRNASPANFFPANEAEAAAAKRVCAGCPVVVPCLALGMREEHGVFGGKTEEEPRKMRKARRRGRVA